MPIPERWRSRNHSNECRSEPVSLTSDGTMTMLKDVLINLQGQSKSSCIAWNVPYFFARERHVINFDYLSVEGSRLAKTRVETIVDAT